MSVFIAMCAIQKEDNGRTDAETKKGNFVNIENELCANWTAFFIYTLRYIINTIR